MNFTFNDHTMRHIVLDGEPWFHATDICRILGLDVSKGTRRHTIKLDEAEQRVVTLSPTVECATFLGRSSRAAAVSESGLYKLIMRSDKDTARPFQDWVTKVVLPSIRKTGGYQASAEQPMDPLMQGLSQFLAGLLEKAQAPLIDRIEKQEAVIVSLKEHIEKLASGESPVDLWFGVPVTEMDDRHIRNAIRWAKANSEPCDHLCRERDRRLARRKAA